jgi:uncharacterized protein YecT (DUF1311 family)
LNKNVAMNLCPRTAVRSFVLLGAIWSGLAWAQSGTDHAAATAWSGRYVGIIDAHGELTIGPDPLDLTLEGGGNDVLGAATPATCTVVGKITATTPSALRAELVPFKRGDFDLDAQDIVQLKPAPLRVERLSEHVVRVSGEFPHCGLQTALSGLYWRSALASMKGARLSQEYEACAGAAPSQATRCIDEEARRQDARLNRRYRELLALLPAQNRVDVRIAQRRWIEQRDRLCSAAQIQRVCLAMTTAARADELETVAKAGAPR